MMIDATRKLAGALLLPLILAITAPAMAQTPPWSTEPVQNQPPPKAAPKAAPAAKAAPAPGAGQAARPAVKETKEDASPPRATESQLRQRVEQLEEQLADMQVMIGTLESLGKTSGGGSASQAYRGGGAAPGSAASGGGVDQARVDSLETQIRALSNQVEQLSGQVRQLSRRGEPGPAAPEAGPAVAAPATRAGTPPDPARAPGPGFGSVTVTPGSERDPVGRMIAENAPPAAPSAPLPPAAQAAGSAKELYETAYGYMLTQDYGSAEVAFEEFLKRHPSDRLAPDAQYWYGETLYVQRRYKPAGQAFLKVIEKHQASAKVPNSLLKLAMTLEQLGQKDCALFSELESRHPNAPADVKSKARTLKQRVGC